MTVRNRAPGARTYRSAVLSVSLLSGLLVGGLVLPAWANDASFGSVHMDASSGGRPVAGTGGMRQTRSIASLNQMHFHHAHHRDRDLFVGGFFPFGFGWPISEPDLTATADDGDGIDWRRPPFWLHVDRYEPPTVEESPSGVTIIRGPGSHHGLSPY
ncbi:MAG TPA: hypothetical protein VJN67_25000 [Stellaceae bacterium]|nr:hypothetical protein [Stellaceae bacterium]